MLIHQICSLQLEAIDEGTLFNWPGPSIRGAYARPFKDAVCRIPISERPERCRGCDFMWHCGYGQSIEPDLPPQAPVIRGRSTPPPGVVIAPEMQKRSQDSSADATRAVRPGDVIPVQAVFFGPAVASVNEILDHLSLNLSRNGIETGRSSQSAGRCRFRLRRDQQDETLRTLLPAALPVTGDSSCVPSLRIELTAPLRIERRVNRERKELIREPQFIDLFRAAARIVESSLTAFGAASPFDLRELNRLGEGVVRRRCHFEPFRQLCQRDRGRALEWFEGVTGWAEFEDVPLNLIPWLSWGGTLHVGERRTSGAGGWRLRL